MMVSFSKQRKEIGVIQIWRHNEIDKKRQIYAKINKYNSLLIFAYFTHFNQHPMGVRNFWKQKQLTKVL